MLTYPDIDPVALDIFGLEIHWYGLMYLIGFMGAWWLGTRRSAREDTPFNKDQVSDLIFYGALGVILGARVGYILFYNFSSFLENPFIILQIWQGGMSFHGGMLGVFIALYVFGRKNKLTFFQVSDFIAPMVPIGLGAGRIGNFINGELVGRVASADLPWAMVYTQVDQLPRHPSQLYQASSEGLLLFIILWLYSSKPRPLMAVSALFLMGYGTFRFTTEFFRTPDAHIGFIAFDWLTMGQLLSLPMVVIGLLMYVIAMKKSKNKQDAKSEAIS